MQKISRIGMLFILILILLVQQEVHAQSKKYFVITGRIVPELGDTGNGSIEVKKNEKEITNIEIPKNGRFRFELEFFNQYNLTFKYPGHFNKIILVNTDIPKEVWERDNDFPPFPMIVQMQQEFEGIDKSFTLKPQGRIFYGKEIDNFEKESMLSDLQFQEQLDAAKAKATQVKKEAQTIAKTDSQDEASKLRSFEQLVKEADTNYQRGEYQTALMKYMEARKLYPDKAYPNDRVAELQDLVKALEITEKQKAELEQKYKAAIAKANGFFDEKNYSGARPVYEEALQYKPGDVFANGRISEIDKFLALLEKQKQYNNLVAEADKNYKSKNFDQAISLYTQASQITPEEQYPKNQISQINLEKQEQAKLDQLDKDFNAFMQTAGTQIQQKDYVQAVNSIKKALAIKPDNQLAKDRMAEVELAMVAVENDKKYQQAIQLADQAFASGDLAKAKLQYQEGLKFKAGEAYPQGKLAEIAKTEAQEIEFSALVANAEKAFAGNNLDESFRLFSQALDLKPKNPAVLKRISDIEAIRKQQLSDKDYSDLLAQGDQAFQNNQLDASVSAYNKALGIKKSESYPKDQIRKIELYLSLVKKADQYITNKDYTAALASLNEALTVKPNDQIAKDKITQVDQLIAARKSEEEKALAQQNAFNEAVKSGDQYFSASDYTQSLAKFKEAQNLKPAESYPKKKIKEIEVILDQQAKDQARNEKEYQASIDQADKLLEKKDYLNAQSGYRKALTIKSEENYPKEQIKKIDDTLAEIQRKEEENQRLLKEKADQAYQLTMTDADKAFNASDFSTAKTGYQSALQIRPNDPAAKQKLGDTDARLAQIARMQQAYNNAITEANKQLTQKNYKEAKSKYQESLQYMPDSDYPKRQISKIDEVLAQQEAELKLKQDYDQAVTEAENLFRNKDFVKAKEAFTKAYNLIPSEPIPPKRISEINDLLAEQARKEAALKATLEAYREVIVRADKLFSSKEYNSARLAYNEALLVKADEKYPVDQLDLIEKLLAEQMNQQYKTAIAKADNLFNTNQFDQAKTSYQEALTYKKNDAYALQRIKDADRKKAELEAENNRLKKLEEDYKAAIADAANDFNNKNYLISKGKYQKAATLKPNESLPKEQIAKIDQILAEIQKKEEINKQYNQHLQLAQQAFGQNKLKEARDEYQKAYNFKPFEPVPPARIAEIDKMLAQLAETAQLAAMEEAQRLAKEKADKEQYAKAIAAADKAFAEKQYKIARNHYTTALIALPGEKYPKDQIAKIDELLRQLELDKALAKQKAVQDSLLKIRDLAFDAAMTAASGFIQDKQFQQAIDKYNEAIQINPSKRNDIQKLIRDAEDKLQLMARQDADYKRFIRMADDLFTASKLQEALAQYQNALNIKNNEEYPKKQIAEIQASLTARDQKYNAAIQKGDQAYDSSDWITAKTGYTEALAIKPAEAYPATRLKDVNQKIADANLAAKNALAQDKAYQDAMEKAEKAFKEDQLTSARMQFQVAQSIKPNEKLPAERINEIDALLDQRNKDRLAQAQKELDERYRKALSVADNSFAGKSYNIAKLQYKQASLIKPEETYPKDQMALCDKFLSEASARETYVNKIPAPEPVKEAPSVILNSNETQQATEARAKTFEIINDYNEAIKKADDSFGVKDYSVARFFYLRASDIKPAEQYPKNQVELIRKLIDSQMSENDLSGYDNAIAQADAAFAKQNYSVAKFYYYKAVEIKSWEKYPKDRINEILALTNSLLSEKEEKEYRDAIAKGDEAFVEKDVAIARFYYNRAISIKKDENYPKIKLKEIQKLIQLDNLDLQTKEYQKILEQGDQAMQYQNYSIARFHYNKALSMRPDDKYPKDQLKLIKEALEKSTK